MATALRQDHFLGMQITPLTRRRLINFRANRRGFWSLWIFLFFFVLSLFAEFIANDKPLVIYYDGGFFVPILVMTASDLKETDLLEAFMAGAYDYLTKPIKATLVRSRVRGWLMRATR